MKFSLSTAVLSTLAASQLASAGLHGHRAKHHHAARHAELQIGSQEKREENHVEARDISSLLSAGFSAVGLNPTAFDASNPGPWIGAGGQYTNTFFNMAHQDMILVMWGPWASWVNTHTPLITITIPSNSSKTISFQDGMTGAWAPFWAGTTQLRNGQVAETWGEYTFANLYSTVDVSREVNMNGSTMKIVSPLCQSDLNTCAFICGTAGEVFCTTGYQLINCDPTQVGQSGAANGWDKHWNAPSGGCGGIKSGDSLVTFIGYKA